MNEDGSVGGVPNDGPLDGAPQDTSNSDTSLPLLPLSCVMLPMTCGANGNDSCCNSPEVVGGLYQRSFDVAGDSSSGTTEFPATISRFRLDKYEVTVGRFRAFVAAGMGTQARPPSPSDGAHAKLPASGWDASWNTNLVANTAALTSVIKCSSTFQTWTDTPGLNENRPMNCVTWYEAMAFCAWDGGYLPTEAEWNYVATGGDLQRAYPWSNPAKSLTLNASLASYGDLAGNCFGDGMPGCAPTDLIAVGTKPYGDGRWGQSDLTGNVWEWTLDWFGTYPTPCTDCMNLAPAMYRVLRGGGFDYDVEYLRAGYRGIGIPSARDDSFGFRCARSAP
jgi:formylglycine-generating enzyme required for sulfatase activity